MWKISIILSFGFLLRILGINWDGGAHLHPDERMLMMVADKIHFFDNLNPEFFNYGSLPIYILKGVGQITDWIFKTNYSMYGEMLYLGRFLSVLADVGVIFLIYKIAKLLFKRENVALLSSFFYSVAFFPIQNSHFFIVDTFLNLFLILLLYYSLLYFKKPDKNKLIILSIIFAACMTTKFTAVIFAPLLAFVIFYKSKKKLLNLFLFTSSFLLFTFLFMPYMFLEMGNFLKDVSLQLELNNNPYIFPYTLQYVGTTPYLYYLKNIFFFGFGPVISVLSIIGGIYFFKDLSEKKVQLKPLKIIFFAFFIFYFIVIGNSSVKFMRYMLPVYPFLVILAAYNALKPKKLHLRGVIIMACLAVIWTFLFLNIYTKEHTRTTASKWIVENIPNGATLAVEHWDDRLPIFNGENYKFEELQLYNQPDNEEKWFDIKNILERSDYIIIASNRLYVPIQTLASCEKFDVCFPITSFYYQRLFAGELDFKKVAEFTSYPNIYGFEFKDDWADESFTVYDHPKVMIFKKEKL